MIKTLFIVKHVSFVIRLNMFRPSVNTAAIVVESSRFEKPYCFNTAHSSEIRMLTGHAKVVQAGPDNDMSELCPQRIMSRYCQDVFS